MTSYIGGKSRISKFIIPYIPTDIQDYCEPFSGMFWVFFKIDISKYPDLKRVIYNDFNKLNVNLFNCVRNYNEFNKFLEKYNSQDSDLFYSSQSNIFNSEFTIDLSIPDYHTAAKYAIVLTQVFSGTNPEKGKFIDLKGKYKSKFDSFKDKVKSNNWQVYFNRITDTENLDFSDLILKYDNEKTFFYCDPPYYKTENYYANHDFGLETHERLANVLRNIKGKFALSYYYFDKLEEWFPKDQYTWREQQFSKAAMAKSGKEQTKGTELLIMNY